MVSKKYWRGWGLKWFYMIANLFLGSAVVHKHASYSVTVKDFLVINQSRKYMTFDSSQGWTVMSTWWVVTCMSKHFCIFHTGSLDDVLTEALLKNKVKFVELILQQGVVMKEYLTVERLEKLYLEVSFIDWLAFWFHMSHVMRKLVFAICEQQRRRSACASMQSDQRLCCSLPR